MAPHGRLDEGPGANQGTLAFARHPFRNSFFEATHKPRWPDIFQTPTTPAPTWYWSGTRTCVETNLTRRGFWLTVAGGPRQLALPREGEDRFGSFTIEPGPRGALTVTELEVLTCPLSRARARART